MGTAPQNGEPSFFSKCVQILIALTIIATIIWAAFFRETKTGPTTFSDLPPIK